MVFLPAPVLVLALLATGPTSAVGQGSEAVRDELLRQFETSMQKFIALAQAMPAERYEWAPGEGVMEVGHVFMHVAHYNYMYPSQNMGFSLPDGVRLDGMEAVREKDRVVAALEASRAWVRETVGAMGGADLDRATRLYGREQPQWAVVVQLVAHMNEHLGQSIAYARMNGTAPPWSR